MNESGVVNILLPINFVVLLGMAFHSGGLVQRLKDAENKIRELQQTKPEVLLAVLSTKIDEMRVAVDLIEKEMKWLAKVVSVRTNRDGRVLAEASE